MKKEKKEWENERIESEFWQIVRYEFAARALDQLNALFLNDSCLGLFKNSDSEYFHVVITLLSHEFLKQLFKKIAIGRLW
jgi:hypothetical protein